MNILETVGWGRIRGGNGAVLSGRGITSIRRGTGFYEISLSSGIEVDDSELGITLTHDDVVGSRSRTFSYIGNSIAKDILAFNSITGAPANTNFWIEIQKLQIL